MFRRPFICCPFLSDFRLFFSSPLSAPSLSPSSSPPAILNFYQPFMFLSPCFFFPFSMPPLFLSASVVIWISLINTPPSEVAYRVRNSAIKSGSRIISTRCSPYNFLVLLWAFNYGEMRKILVRDRFRFCGFYTCHFVKTIACCHVSGRSSSGNLVIPESP